MREKRLLFNITVVLQGGRKAPIIIKKALCNTWTTSNSVNPVGKISLDREKKKEEKNMPDDNIKNREHMLEENTQPKLLPATRK